MTIYTQTLLLVLVQWGYTALLRAAYGGSVHMVRMLLEDFAASLNEMAKVSTEVLPM